MSAAVRVGGFGVRRPSAGRELDGAWGRELCERQVIFCRSQFEIAQSVVIDEQQEKRSRGERLQYDA